MNSSGRRLGEELYSVHQVLRQFLSEVLLIDPLQAEHEACRMEHGLSKTTLKRLALFLEVIANCGGTEPKCMGTYRQTLELE